MFGNAKEPEQSGFRSTKPAGRESELVKHDPLARTEPPRPVMRTATPVAVPPRPASPPTRPSATASAVQSPAVAAVVHPVAVPPVGAPKPAPSAVASAGAAMLVAGPGVTLKGNMQCDMLRVEGSIEGDVKARKLVISSGGMLMGTAEIEDAEVEGLFEGTLLVAGHLIVRSTGRLSGKFQYGEIEIERGGAITGEVSSHSHPAAHEDGTSIPRRQP